MSKIEVERVYKIFGRGAEEAVHLLEQGVSREEVQEKTASTAAVIDASFKVEEGEIFVVMGLSGSGKSTLVRTLNRLYEPTSGTIRIDDTDITALNPEGLRKLRAGKISMVFQHFALFPHRSVLDNTAWGLEVRRVPNRDREERSRRALELVGLAGWESSYPGQLSGGMRQRVGLARALATDADILLMDEAFSALDPLIRREMQEQLIDLQQNLHKTIVFITHDLNEAMLLGDRIAMLKDGRVVQIGTAEDILRDPATDYVATFTQDVDRSRVLTASSVMEQPPLTIPPYEGPRAALEMMRKHQVSALFVVGAQRRLVGAVFDDDIIEAARREVDRLDEIVRTDFPRVAPDTFLADCLVPSAESPLSLPVVDEDGRIVGVVPRVTLLLALGGKETPDDQQNEQARPPNGPEADNPIPGGDLP